MKHPVEITSARSGGPVLPKQGTRRHRLTWREAFLQALVTGSVASMTSTAALSLCGLIEEGRWAAPNNAPSQWVWGEREAYRRRPSVRHTLVGYLVHHAMSIAWATVHAKCFSRPGECATTRARLVQSATTAAVACFVDYRVARGRLQPGFDKHLSRPSLAVVYASFALGLFAADWFADRQSRRSR
jgi:hypothetical protein